MPVGSSAGQVSQRAIAGRRWHAPFVYCTDWI